MVSVIKKPERELFVTEIVSQTFTMYASRFFPFFLVFFFASLVNNAFSNFMDSIISLPAVPDVNASEAQILAWFSVFIGAFILLVLLTFIVSWVVNNLANGLAVKYTSDVLETGDASLERGLRFTAYKLPSLLAAGLISAVLIVVGLIALVIPGIIIAIMFSLIVQVIMIERVGAFDSFGRSRRLVSGRWLKTFGLFLIIFIIIIVVGLIGDAIGLLFGPASWIVSSLVSAFVQPILPIAFTLFYYSMKVKEAAFTRQWPPSPPPPPSAAPPVPSSAAPLPPTPTAAIKFCPYCGGTISPETIFCPYCGKNLQMTT